MLEHLEFRSLIAVLVCLLAFQLVTAAWLLLVARRTSASRISFRALGVSVVIDKSARTRTTDAAVTQEGGV